jgi:hypothetical protein
VDGRARACLDVQLLDVVCTGEAAVVWVLEVERGQMDMEDMAWAMAVVEETGMAGILVVKEIDRFFDASVFKCSLDYLMFFGVADFPVFAFQ